MNDADPNPFDDLDEAEDRITCQRCGTPGLHWKDIISSDGKSERPQLFNERNRPHVCPLTDDFEVVK